jgi:hypothetical protein
LGGFRTPARAYIRDLRWPASGNLHQLGRSADGRRASEADAKARIEIYSRRPGAE